MTPSEKLRLYLALFFFLVFLAKRFDLLGKLREKRRKKERQEAARHRVQAKKDRRQQEQEQREQRKVQTAEILKRGLGLVRQKSVQAAGQEIWYLEGGAKLDAESILLLHGFAGGKEDWSGVADLLINEGYHIVAPDLPGFGQNEKNPNHSYDVTSQAKRIKAFAQKSGLERFHVIGHSVGGSIGAALAYAAPSEVASLTLIEPFGVRVPYESELDKLLGQNRNPMVIASPVAYDNLLGFVFHHPPEMPPALKKLRAEQTAENRVFQLRMWQEIREGERAHLLDLLLPVIKLKTLVIQGAESNVIHPTTPGVIQAMMTDAHHATIDDCGHFTMVERPQQTAEWLLEFLKTVPEPPAE